MLDKYASRRKLCEKLHVKLTTRVKHSNVWIRARICDACQTWALQKLNWESETRDNLNSHDDEVKEAKKRIDPEKMNFDDVITQATILAKC